MEERIALALRETLNADAGARRGAEEYLSARSGEEGFMVALLRVVVLVEDNQAIALAASVQLKNFVWLNWARNEEEEAARREMEARDSGCIGFRFRKFHGNLQPRILAEKEREVVRSNMLEAMARTQSAKVRAQLGDCVKKIADEDFPDRWRCVVQGALELIVTGDPGKMHAGLLTLDKIAVNYKYIGYEKKKLREPIDEVAAVTFGSLFELMNGILSQGITDLYAAELLKLIGKVFLRIIYKGMPPYLKEGERLRNWCVLFTKLLCMPVPEGQPTSIDERRRWPWWKAKTWAAKILFRLLDEYGYPTKEDSRNKDLCLVISKKTGIMQEVVLPGILKLLHDTFEKGEFCLLNVMSYVLLMVSGMTEFSTMFKALKPELPFLMSKVIIPSSGWSHEELELWDVDPQAFVTDLFSFDRIYSGRGISLSEDSQATLKMISRARKRYVVEFLISSLTEIASNYAKMRNDFQAANLEAAALGSLKAIVHIFAKDKSFPLEAFLREVVIPDTQSPFPFVRLKAIECLATGVRHSVEWSSEDAERLVAQRMLEGLADTSLPVRVQASCDIGLLFKHGTPVMDDIVKNIVGDVVKALISTMKDVSIEQVYASVQDLIRMHADLVVPYGIEVCRSLAQAFWIYSAEDSDFKAGGEGYEVESAVNSNLESLVTLLQTLCDENVNKDRERRASTIRAVIPITLPVAHFIIAMTAQMEHQDGEKLDKLCLAISSQLCKNEKGEVPSTQLEPEDFLTFALNTVHILISGTKSVEPSMWSYFPLFMKIRQSFGLEYEVDMISIMETMIHYDPAGFLGKNADPTGELSNLKIALDFAFDKIVAAAKEAILEAGESNRVVEADSQGDDEAGEADGIFQLQQRAFDEFNTRQVDIALTVSSTMLCTILQVCQGQLDNILQRIIDDIFGVVDAPFDDHTIVASLLNVIESAIFYNPSMALSFIGPKRMKPFFQKCFEYLESHLIPGAKLTGIFAFIKILALPLSQVHGDVMASVPDLLDAIAVLSESLYRLRASIEHEKREAEEEEQQNGNLSPSRRKALRVHDEAFSDLPLSLFLEGPTDVNEDENVFEISDAAGGFDFDEEESDEEEDEDDNGHCELPVESIDETRFFFEMLQSAPAESRNRVEQALSTMNQDRGSILKTMLKEGRRRSIAQNQQEPPYIMPLPELEYPDDDGGDDDDDCFED